MLTRFAPAPTGWLHLGHVLNAEHVWGCHTPAAPPAAPKPPNGAGGRLAERRRVLLRIEDHDRERCRPGYDAGILEDLDWLGYRPDFPVVRQSERHAIYREAVDVLVAQGLVYGCDCTRKQVEARGERRGAGGAAGEAGALARRSIDEGVRREARESEELWYDGHCRERGLSLIDGAGWRVRLNPGVERFDDAMVGPQEQDPSQQCGDLLIRDRLGNWTYQFAAAADDFRQGIDLVIRGMDLLPSTGRQIRIARLLGRAQPATFAHHFLIMKSADRKLSKSDGDTGVRDLRARGWTAEEVNAAARLGSLRLGGW